MPFKVVVAFPGCVCFRAFFFSAIAFSICAKSASNGTSIMSLGCTPRKAAILMSVIRVMFFPCSRRWVLLLSSPILSPKSASVYPRSFRLVRMRSPTCCRNGWMVELADIRTKFRCLEKLKLCNKATLCMIAKDSMRFCDES